MRTKSSLAGVVALLAPVAALTAAAPARAIDYQPYCSSAPAPTTPVVGECEVRFCSEVDRSWDTRPLDFGTKCGSVDPLAGRKLSFCDGEGRCRSPERSRITPLYMILDVRYLPPGPSSNVTASRTKKVALTTSISDSFNVTAGVEFVPRRPN